jgi:hypothetical protein
MVASDETVDLPRERRLELGLSGLPEPWNCPSEEVVDRALRRTLLALRDDGPRPLLDRMRSYYRVDGNFAGADFLEMEPTDHDAVTPSDLLATSLLSVRISAYAARQFWNRDVDRQEFARLLDERVLPYPADLTSVGPLTFVAMEELYSAVKRRLSLPTTKDPNARVTASKICARKRPALFPIRDTVVRHYLGLDSHWSWQSDWVVFRHLIGHGDVIGALEDAATTLRRTPGVRIDKYRLRWLDVALWTYAVGHDTEVEDDPSS